MRTHQQPQQQRRGGLRLALLVCLLALSHGASAQGLLDMFENGAAATPDATTPTTTTPETTTTTPTTTTPTTTTPETTTPSPATTTPAPATTTPAPATTTPAPVTTPSPATTTTPAPATTTPSPATTTTPAPATTTTPAPATTTTPAPATTTTPNITTPAVGSPNTTTPAGTTTTAPVPLNAGNVTTGTPAVDMAPGADAAAVSAVGTVTTEQQLAAENTLPPGPPMDWTTLQKDCQLVFDVEIRGAFIVPFTSPKATVIARVLRDRYLRSAQLPDISVQAMNPFMYLSYDKLDADDALSDAQDEAAAASGATGSAAVGGRRRLASRDLLQIEKSGAELRIVVATSSVRTDSEMATFEEGVESGRMARDFTLAGIDTENLTLLMPPYQEELIGPGTVDEDAASGGTQSWVVGVIVGVILLLLPVPLFMLVRSGSMGGLAGYANNGRLNSWSGSPERQYGQYNPYGISRQTSATSMGSALQSARGPSYTRTPSLPGQPRAPFQGPMAPPPGAYEEELQTARSTRSQNGGQ
ncbi:expressed protein [Chlorella variabilis]|uniref:Expressed protein n=1 Tax=Chlorella variabilis TaxID=554065 RepID=E1ZAH8_CHLVA|nr:expressed protein [Chlorella variabilis]EFN57262.1 expressed protein [Chlorella variabilis]|eukprot:XP_005849364.1 expressed protein [Chlorella variabilis]